jgi:subtilisin-like proprotein convertase family protein
VVALTLTVTSDQGTLTVPVSLPLGSGSGTADSTDVPKTIDDNNRASDSATSTLAVTGAGRAGHVRVTISIAHTFVGDLHGWLISPAGTVVNLFEDVGLTEPSSGDGFSGVVLDDGAAGSIQDVPVPDGPALTGTYSPDEPLGALAGESRTGTWTLKVVDDSARDVGSLSSWSLSTDDPVCGTPPAGAPSSGPGSIFSLPKSRLTGFPKSVTLDRRGRITLRFTATPASTAGSLSLRSAQRVALTKRAHKRLLTAGSATFSVPKTTRVRLRLRVSATARSYLRRHRSLKTRAVLRINGTPFTVPLMLKAHK